MPDDEVPDYLKPAKELLVRAFPEGPSRDAYYALLVVMAPSFSSRNLACIIQHAFQIPYSAALNDVYGARGGELNVPGQAVEEVTMKLRSVGYDQWVENSKGV